MLQHVVIDPVELFSKIGCSLQQKSPQALWTRVTRKAGQILKGAIRTQQRCRLQTIQTQDDRVDQGQNHLGKLVVLVAPRIAQMPSQEAAQLQHSNELTQK